MDATATVAMRYVRSFRNLRFNLGFVPVAAGFLLSEAGSAPDKGGKGI